MRLRPVRPQNTGGPRSSDATFPGRFFRHKEVVLIWIGQLLFNQRGLQLFGCVLGMQNRPISLKLVVDPLEVTSLP